MAGGGGGGGGGGLMRERSLMGLSFFKFFFFLNYLFSIKQHGVVGVGLKKKRQNFYITMASFSFWKFWMEGWATR